MAYYDHPQYPKSDTPPYADNIALDSGINYQSPTRLSQYSRFDPRGWRTRTRLIAVGGVVVILIAIIVGAYEGVKANRYPDYSPLNYSLKDTYEGENFFDNFWYWSDADPTAGFVVLVPFFS